MILDYFERFIKDEKVRKTMYVVYVAFKQNGQDQVSVKAVVEFKVMPDRSITFACLQGDADKKTRKITAGKVTSWGSEVYAASDSVFKAMSDCEHEKDKIEFKKP